MTVTNVHKDAGVLRAEVVGAPVLGAAAAGPVQNNVFGQVAHKLNG